MNGAPENYAEIEMETIANAGHEAVRIYSERRGDFRHQPWGTLLADEKMPARHGAIGVVCEDHTPEQSHEAWRAARAALGWRYGAVVRNEEIKNRDGSVTHVKEHPCMVPWAQLPFEEQVKNRLFVETVRAMSTALKAIANQ